MDTIQVFIKPTHMTKLGQFYEVEVEGDVLPKRTHRPEEAAISYIRSLGMKGRVEVWDRVLPYPRTIYELN